MQRLQKLLQKIDPIASGKNINTEKESTLVRYEKTYNLRQQTDKAKVQISTKNIFIKLCIFKYNLTTESCEHPLKFQISARHCSMSTGIIP